MDLNLFFPSTLFWLSLQKIKREQQLSQTSSKVGRKEPIKTDPRKQNDHTAIPDARVRQLKDQLIRARVYLSLSATRSNPHFTREIRGRMKEVQRALGDASKDSELPRK
jgi:alpha-1,4-galacturonosyltransferase